MIADIFGRRAEAKFTKQQIEDALARLKESGTDVDIEEVGILVEALESGYIRETKILCKPQWAIPLLEE